MTPLKRARASKQEQRRDMLETALLFLAIQQQKRVYAKTASNVQLEGSVAIRFVMKEKGDAWVRKALAYPKVVKALVEADAMFGNVTGLS